MAALWENSSSDVWIVPMFRCPCASVQPNQNLHFKLYDQCMPCRLFMRSVKYLIRLHQWGSWFNSSLVAHVQRFLFSWWGLRYINSANSEDSRLQECQSQSQFLLAAHVWRYIFWGCGRTNSKPWSNCSKSSIICVTVTLSTWSSGPCTEVLRSLGSN